MTTTQPDSIPFAVVPSGAAQGSEKAAVRPANSGWLGIPASSASTSTGLTLGSAATKGAQSSGVDGQGQPTPQLDQPFAPSVGMWMLLSALVVVGAVIGGLVTGLTGPTYTAVTLVQGAPARLDPGALTQEDDRYVQTEAAFAGLSEGEIGTALVEQLARPDVTPATVTVVPGTTILRFVGTGDSAQEAADVANISAQAYVTGWRSRMSTALIESIAVIDSAAASATDNSGQLGDQRAILGTQLEAVQSLQRIVQPATAQTSEPTANYAAGAVLGGLVGATCGLVALLWWRRRRLSDGGDL